MDKDEQSPEEKLAEMERRLAERQAAFMANVERLYGPIDTDPEPFPVLRNEKGQFLKGTPSPNPVGAPRKEQRRFGMTQTAKDLLELFEEPVTIIEGGRKQQVPAILGIYRQVIHMAVKGDWQAIRKCLELRERYSMYREKTLVDLMGAAQDVRVSYRDAGQKMPDDVLRFVEFVEAHVTEGQFRAA